MTGGAAASTSPDMADPARRRSGEPAVGGWQTIQPATATNSAQINRERPAPSPGELFTISHRLELNNVLRHRGDASGPRHRGGRGHDRENAERRIHQRETRAGRVANDASGGPRNIAL